MVGRFLHTHNNFYAVRFVARRTSSSDLAGAPRKKKDLQRQTANIVVHSRHLLYAIMDDFLPWMSAQVIHPPLVILLRLASRSHRIGLFGRASSAGQDEMGHDTTQSTANVQYPASLRGYDLNGRLVRAHWSGNFLIVRCFEGFSVTRSTSDPARLDRESS